MTVLKMTKEEIIPSRGHSSRIKKTVVSKNTVGFARIEIERDKWQANLIVFSSVVKLNHTLDYAGHERNF
jgi:hypothetical protein